MTTNGSGGAAHERPSTRPTATPAVDIVESTDALVIYADLPGVSEDAVSVTLDDQVLTISARPTPEAFEGLELAAREYDLVDYARSFKLAEHVATDRIEARLKNGVLALRLPKARPEARKIAVLAE